ncbi:MAG: hypothetical protein HOY79_30015, partial [Streptomyces sp.]|nr:hypothetical protein [Streptomyces sp.]
MQAHTLGVAVTVCFVPEYAFLAGAHLVLTSLSEPVRRGLRADAADSA